MRWEGAQQALGHFRQRSKSLLYGAAEAAQREKSIMQNLSVKFHFAKENSSILSFQTCLQLRGNELSGGYRKIKVPEQIGITGYDDN